VSLQHRARQTSHEARTVNFICTIEPRARIWSLDGGDPPEKPAGVHDALHQKALREARKSLWEDLKSGDYIYFTLRDFIAEEFAGYYRRALADLTAERKQAA
jgi:hypothetical protein